MLSLAADSLAHRGPIFRTDWQAYSRALSTFSFNTLISTQEDVKPPRTRCPRVKTRLNRLKEELSVAVKAYRGEAWERRIEKTAEHQISLHQLNRQLYRKPQLICSLVGSDRRKHGAAQDRAKNVAEHLEEQFTANPSAPDTIAFKWKRAYKDYYCETGVTTEW